MIYFQPNCTLPTVQPSGFVQSPNIRSTMDIVWSCVSIILLSTWSVLFLTVPPDIKAMSTWQRFKKQAYYLRRKVVWMVIMLMFPEYLLAIGFANLFAARQNNPKLEELAKEDSVPWSLTHTILADMGGIAVRFSENSILKPPEQCCQQLLKPENDTSAQVKAAAPQDPDHISKHDVQSPDPEKAINAKDPKKIIESGEINEDLSIPSVPEHLPDFLQDFQTKQMHSYDDIGELAWTPIARHVNLAVSYTPPPSHIPPITEYNHIAPLQGNVWVLDSKQLCLARRHGIIQKMPIVEYEQIQDKSKSDGLVRLLALIQVFWLIAQLIGRWASNSASSALEFSTLAFSSCAAIIYMIEWCKPKDITVPIYMDTDVMISTQTFQIIVEAAPTVFMRNRLYNMPQSCVHQILGGHFEGKHIDRLIVLMCILSTSLFGGIHLLAWNLHFPNHVEKTLWRIATLLVISIPSVCALSVLAESMFIGTTNKMSRLSSISFAPLYFASRIYLIAESFRSLYYLPPEAFIATWASNSPHVE